MNMDAPSRRPAWRPAIIVLAALQHIEIHPGSEEQHPRRGVMLLKHNNKSIHPLAGSDRIHLYIVGLPLLSIQAQVPEIVGRGVFFRNCSQDA
jgi:hypothetical protein